MDNPVVPPGGSAARRLASYSWWLILCLVGLDYFSTLAYLPSMAVENAGYIMAPVAALLVAAITLLVALPIYLYVVGRSPHGQGATGLLESHLHGWGGKLLVLVLLGFVATDFVITRTLSAADASQHLIHNSFLQDQGDWFGGVREWLRDSMPPGLRGPTADSILDWWNEQLVATVALSVLGFALYFTLLRSFTRRFMVVAAAVVVLFLAVNGIVIGSGLVYLAKHPDYMTNWVEIVRYGGRPAHRVYVGMQGRDLDAAEAAELGLEEQGGVVVVSVRPDSPAAEAGLQEGDILTGLGDDRVEDDRQLRSLVGGLSPDKPVTVRVLRDGERKELQMTPEEQASESGMTESVAATLALNAFDYFPLMALGLSGFELSMASVGLVRGRREDDPTRPRGRIRNARKLLVTAALVMSVLVVGSVSVVTLLVPPGAVEENGRARNRALAYLAHGSALQPAGAGATVTPPQSKDTPPDKAVEPPNGDQPEGAKKAGRPAPKRAVPMATEINPLFGPAFGTLYDVSAILILFLAGASVTISLRDLLPEYLTRYGMEMHWSRKVGTTLHLFNLIILAVIFYFHASVSHQQGAYATSVLVLLASAALAALLDFRSRFRHSTFLPLLIAPLVLACGFFLLMAWKAAEHSLVGLVIAGLFVLVLLVTAGISRWVRSTELRFQGFRFADEESQKRWEEIRQLDFQVLVPHRPDHRSLAEKEEEIRARHRLGPDVPIIFVEAELGDPSDFQHEPLMQIVKEKRMEVIRVSRCASIAHVLAAIALAFREVGRPPEVHFAWSGESPLAANLHFLLWGEGNIPWMVHSLIRHAEPDPDRQPRVVIG
jgi:membrane-associated protease RseP (regulator of RpoE activity)